jgi:putative sigma-54 modulation protein
MNLSITGRHLEITAALRNHIKDKIGKLSKHSHKIIEADVILEVEKYRHAAEIIMQLNGTTLSAKEETEDMYTSIDRALDKIERQLRKYKDRCKTHNLSKAAKKKGDNSVGEEEIWNENEPMVVKSRRFAAKPMSTDEAAMQMQLSDNNFLAFTNAHTTQVNVIYRRKDGKLGLIEPEH